METKKIKKEVFKGIQPDMAPKQNKNHEWERKYQWFYECSHCQCVKIISDLGSHSYIPKGHPHSSKSLIEEPACIIRQQNPDDNKIL